MSRDRFDSESSVQRVIDEFERCAIVTDRWGHEVRLVVTMWYLLTHEEAEATARLISGMRAMARTHDRPRERFYAYNETATVFWMAIARLFLSVSAPGIYRLDVLNRFLERYGGREFLILEHYEQHTLQSWEARSSWVEPDLKPLTVSLPDYDVHANARANSEDSNGCRPDQG